eukprot:9734305-Ditylum_brightwellii.AAC.1
MNLSIKKQEKPKIHQVKKEYSTTNDSPYYGPTLHEEKNISSYSNSRGARANLSDAEIYNKSDSHEEQEVSRITSSISKESKEEKPDKEEKSLDDSATSYRGHPHLISNGEEIQPNETNDEFFIQTNYSGYDSYTAEHNEKKIDPNASNPELTDVCPIDRNITAGVYFRQGDEGLIQLAKEYGHTNTDQYLLGSK